MKKIFETENKVSASLGAKSGRSLSGRLASLLMAGLLMLAMTGCGTGAGSTAGSTTESSAVESGNSMESGSVESTGADADNAGTANEGTDAGITQADTAIRVGSLKGPTSLGLLFMMEDAGQGLTQNEYTFQMATAADELLPLLVKGDLDIALVPANVAAVLYNNTEGAVRVIDINTLGVLYMVSGDGTVEQVSDLVGKTIYLTGKGTTPDYVLQYILAENGLEEGDYTLEYKSEATEVAALLGSNPDAIGLLPQPFVTAACMQNEALSIVLDMNEEWQSLQGEGGSSMVTGVTVVRREFLEENEAAVQAFLEEHAQSAAAIGEDTPTGAVYAVEAGIVAKEPIALKAIPDCNITYVDGAEMKQALSGYLEVLYNQSPDFVGGRLPEDDFYYVP